MLDFGSLPPEINSARMYTGPGPGSMLAAAGAWQDLADELNSVAASYGSIISGLTGGGWTGPSATSMAAAAAPYVTWLGATGAQAERAAGQAGAAAAAYETALAATVPPPLIAANRSELASLVATNFLGQNTPAIAATEAEYLEMWAQDAAAMYGYAAASSVATNFAPFTSPPQTTDPAGLAGQAAAVAQTVGPSAGMPAETLMSAGPQLISATPPALQALASPVGLESLTSAGSSGSTSSMASLSSLSMLTMPARMAMMPMSMLMRMFMMGGMGGANGASKAAAGLSATTAGTGTAGAAVGVTLASGTGGLGSTSLAGLAGSASPATAGLGQATSIGALSVPPGWAGFSPASGPAAAVLSSANAGAASSTGVGHAAVPPMMPITNTAPRSALGGPAAQYDFRPTVIPRSPAAG